jgi:hypothetical protein
MLKLGKRPARPGAVSLKFADVFNIATLPVPPLVFGHESFIPGNSWGMLANDRWGDCVFAGAAHETMTFTAEGSDHPAIFTSAGVLSDYSAVTGFDPSNPASDQGTDVQAAAAYRQKMGVIDANGVRHKIDAYADIAVGNLDQLATAIYIFGAAGVGVALPSSAEDQFNQSRPWSIVSGDTNVGGHYVPFVGRNSAGNFIGVTWGRLQAAEPDWLKEYMDEGICYLSVEILKATTKLSPEGYNLDALTQYLKEV